MKQIEALREREHQQQQQQQRTSVDSAPKKFFETDHTNASANSSGDGSGWTEVSVAPQIMEMKQAGGISRIAARFCNTSAQADLAAKSIRRFLRNLDTGA